MTSQNIRFSIAPGDRARFTGLVFGAKRWQVPAYCGIGVAYGALGAAELFILPGHDRLAGYANLLLAAIWVASAAFISRRSRSGLAAEASLELSATGLTGTLDGAPVTIGWSQIVQVSDLGEALTIVRRPLRAKRIVIPWSSVADPAAFWQTCEDHLIAKRGLIRAPAAAGRRRMIVNTVS